jgi:quinol monooxygenase YgiN
VDVEDPLRLVFLEKWRDQAALLEHFRQPGSKAFMRVVRALNIGREPMEAYEASELSV